MPRLPGAMFVLLAACSSGTPMAGDAPPQQVDTSPPADASGVVAASADAICRALFRCCDDDLDLYFAPMRENQLLAGFRDRLPPASEADCRAVVGEMFAITPLGDWIRAVDRGEVTYDAAAFGACLAKLDGAACGAAAREALWDSSCLGFAAPSGGSEQRSMFRRSRGAGAACGPIRDGVGAAFYGTCDPATTFCCYSDPAKPGCQLPFDASGQARPGSCAAVASTGQACSPFQPIQLCATGEDCDADTATCVAPSAAPLAVGAACIDAGYHSLGVCQGSWCDVLGTKRCEARRQNGAACTGGDECESGRCQSTCIENTVCTASGSSVLDGERGSNEYATAFTLDWRITNP